MKSKILTIFCIIMFLISFILINNVYAASYDLSDYKNYVSGKRWIITYKVSNKTFYLVTTTASYLYGNSVHLVDEGYDYIDSTILSSNDKTTNPWGNPTHVSVYVYDTSTKTFNYSSNPSWYDCGESYIIASNCTVYNATNHSTFFQQTPVPSMVYLAPTTLAEELEIVQVKEVWKNLMKTLVVSLIVFLVGLVGLRKAWTFLKTALHKA